MRRALIGFLLIIAAACGTSVESEESFAPTSTEVATTTTPATTAPPTTAPTRASTTTTSAGPSSTTTTPQTTTTLAPLIQLSYEQLAGDLSRPLAAMTWPGDGRLLIVERRGVILIHEGDGILPDPFLDISDVVSDTGIEMGLLGLAFHPDFSENGRFFVYYTDTDENNHLVEYGVGDDGRGDPTSAREVLYLEEPTGRHNGGNLQFGPDGTLWLAVGEGGGAAEHAQNPATLLGSVLRFDVDTTSPGRQYGIPADNPWATGGEGAPEVWAYGLRNPWRWDLDAETGLLYIADVGHEEWEEIDVVPIDEGGGYNFGWLHMEGPECFALRDCDPADYTGPVHWYRQDEGCSIIGGFVYRGQAIPELTGRFLYSDWCGGWLRSILVENGTVVEEVDWTDQVGIPGQINSFGEDADGEIYVTTWEGDVFKLVAVRG